MSAISIFQLEHTVPNEIPLAMIIEQPFENNPIKMRTQTITKQCINPYRSGNITSYEYMNIKDLPMNLAPFINRCQINKDIFKENHAEWQEVFMNTKIGYIHNYKSAGTTIQECLHRLTKFDKLDGEFVFNEKGGILRWNLRFLNDTKYWDNREKWYSLMSDIFLFSLVRDPIDKFIRSYFEIHTRQIKLFQIYNLEHLHGMDRFRTLLNIFINNTYKYLLDKTRRDKKLKMKMLWSGEAHLHPQTLFLLRQDLGFYPFDYIGDLKYFKDIWDPILYQFVERKRQETRYNPCKYYRYAESYKDYGKDNVESDFNIKRVNLTDDDIRTICEIYWIDYICFPFDVPKQCNITDLFIKHYNKHVTYNDCYFH